MWGVGRVQGEIEKTKGDPRMKITGYENITRDQLIKNETVLQKVIYNTSKSQVQLKDGLFTVAALLRLTRTDNLQWGA